ncbi:MULTISPECIES: CBS domain-containing protein [Halomonadaceae]|jgi:signal-transduction protein with cAMP-binding, CBS, and nucleotidyltransferase domain|uniref:CBS domain-containing protein n=1 Tax=Billgrantia aerodenitrificans TaxID=2733483 RepID=A0ABS9AS60_9GAMM|nr:MULTISPECIES: CBS domain-containing protein [Halomonas]MCE8024472.1 CBS domain-containing protein [Halomonas aerodenitrificans]MCE8036643.1 CBS domain-containing protein [Halomonas sp. MCCC 1A11062]
MLVKDIMNRDVVTVSPFATLRDALSLMKRHNIKSLVVEQQDPHDAWGLITYTNILKTIVAENGDIDLINVYDVCAKPAIGVGESLDVRHVASLMTDSTVKRVLVLDDNKLLGLVTMDDIVGTVLDMIE